MHGILIRLSLAAFFLGGLLGLPAHAQFSGARVVAACNAPAPWPAKTAALAVNPNMSLCLANGGSGSALTTLIQANGVKVIQACGTPAPWPTLNASSVSTASAGWLAVNQNMSLCNSAGGGGGGCAQATAYLARTTGGNEGGNAANITTLICGLVTDGTWANLDALYVFAQQTQADSLLNLVGTSYTATNVSSTTFTSLVGYTFSSNGYLDTNFNPAMGTPLFTQNSASFGIWIYAGGTESSPEIGNGATSTGSLIYSHFTDNNFYARVNDSTAGGVVSPGTKGFFVADRATSAAAVPYWNGASQGSVASTSGAVLSNDFLVGSWFQPMTDTASAVHIGVSLGSAGNLALYNRLRTYATAVGIP